MRWSVIIPSASAENLIRSIGSIIRTHPGLDPSRIVVVDDGARDIAESQLGLGISWLKGIKPFVFARNANLGIRGAMHSSQFILMNDDAEVLSLNGLEVLSRLIEENANIGLLSAGIVGASGSSSQQFNPGKALVLEEDMLSFVCVAFTKRTWERVGALDERFTGYGCEDGDFCWRVRKAGLGLAVTNRCVVRHDGSIPSTYRSRSNLSLLFRENLDLLRQKWPRNSVIP